MILIHGALSDVQLQFQKDPKILWKFLESSKWPKLLGDWITEDPGKVVEIITSTPDKFMTVSSLELLIEFFKVLEKSSKELHDSLLTDLKDSNDRNVFHHVSTFGQSKESVDMITLLMNSLDKRALANLLMQRNSNGDTPFMLFVVRNHDASLNLWERLESFMDEGLVE